MAEIIRMPKMSDTMTEGVIVAWNKKVGDPVKSGDILAEVETDKATMELENYVKGTLLHIGVEQGQAVPVDAIIAIVGKEGEDISSLLSSQGPSKASITQPEAASNPETSVPMASKEEHQGSTDEHRVKASPLAKKMAADLGISLSQIQGTGDHGRIVRRDIENYQGSAHSVTPPASGL
ncbi:MAG: biotin/lipoyl-containing protein, partial [Bacteroidota bacterium]